MYHISHYTIKSTSIIIIITDDIVLSFNYPKDIGNGLPNDIEGLLKYCLNSIILIKKVHDLSDLDL
jgi:hypothetical protein